jgi:hypothetical protein
VDLNELRQLAQPWPGGSDSLPYRTHGLGTAAPATTA